MSVGVAAPARRHASRRHRALAFARSLPERHRALQELRTFVAYPSISGDARHTADVAACARWLAAELSGIGLERVRLDGDIVWGRWCAAPGRPTALIYGHYDVVGVQPAAAWRHPPFEPVVRDGRLHGRGASDDKGQLFSHVKSLEAYLRAAHELPVNVVCVFEGSEEIGSPGLEAFVRARAPALRCDAVVVSDTRMLGPGRPALTYGLRGSLTLELEVTTGRRPLHSGHMGGSVLSAAQALSEIIATLHRRDGRIDVPGFEHAVRAIDARERHRAAATACADAASLRSAGIPRPWGDARFTPRERTTLRPALVVTSLSVHGGGATTIPVTARAGLNVRLVPDQDPDVLERRLRKHVMAVTPVGAAATLRRTSASSPLLVDVTEPALAAAVRAYRKGMGATPALTRSGGTIPGVEILSRLLDAPAVLMGFASPEDNVHGPNESFALTAFFDGIATAIHFLAELGESPAVRQRLRPDIAGGALFAR